MKRAQRLLVLAATVVTLQAMAADTDNNQPMRMPSTMPSPSQMQGARGMQEMGGQTVELGAVTNTFTVQNVDPKTRMVTLKAPDGSTEKFKCGPEVRNFDQIRQGDQVKATVVDETAVGIRPGGQAGEAQNQMIAVAPKGAKPGMVMIQTNQMTGKILAIDTDKRMVSVEGPMGADHTIKVAPKVDLSQLKKGQDVTLQVVQGMAITVQSPGTSAQPAGGTMQPDLTQPKDQEQKSKDDQ